MSCRYFGAKPVSKPVMVEMTQIQVHSTELNGNIYIKKRCVNPTKWNYSQRHQFHIAGAFYTYP